MTNKKVIAGSFVLFTGIMLYLAVGFYTSEERQPIPIAATKSLKLLVPYLNVAENGRDEQALHLIPRLFGFEGKQVLISLWEKGEIEGERYERVSNSLTLRLVLASELVLIDKEGAGEYKEFIYKHLYNESVEVRAIATFALGNVDEIKSIEELQRILSHEKEALQLANAVVAVEQLYEKSTNRQVKLKAKDIMEKSKFGVW